MKKSAKWFAFIAIIGLGFSGCATITNTPKQQVSLVSSNGEKVVVTIKGEKITLPTTMKLSRKPTDIYVYAEDNPGYQYSHTSTFVVGAIEESPVTLLNVFGIIAMVFPGLTSILIDHGTVSAWEYANKEMVIPVYKAAK